MTDSTAPDSRENPSASPIVLRTVMRKIVARVGSEVTALRCTDCGWTYSIHHLFQAVDDIEEQQAIRLFTAHECKQFPADEGETLKAS